MPDELVMQCMPAEPLPAPEYIAYGYGAPVYFGHLAPQFPQVYQLYEPPNQGYRQDNGKRGSFKTRGRKVTPSYVHHVAITYEMESAIVAIKTNPEVTLFSIHGEFTLSGNTHVISIAHSTIFPSTHARFHC
jgi:hypothetical protein